MRSIAVAASNRDMTMHGAPRAVGVKCEVQMPKPNGAGTRLMNTSSAVSSPASTASSWNANHRCWSCTTTFGSPVVPDVELRRNTSFGREPPLARRTHLADADAVDLGDEVAGAGAGHEVVDLAGPGPRADAHHDQARLLAGDERGVHPGPSAHLHGDPVARAGSPRHDEVGPAQRRRTTRS